MASHSGTTPTPTNLAANPEVVVVATRKVACDGGGGALGHPKVWYDMSEHDHVECKYCDRLFVLKGGNRDPGKSA